MLERLERLDSRFSIDEVSKAVEDFNNPKPPPSPPKAKRKFNLAALLNRPQRVGASCCARRGCLCHAPELPSLSSTVASSLGDSRLSTPRGKQGMSWSTLHAKLLREFDAAAHESPGASRRGSARSAQSSVRSLLAGAGRSGDGPPAELQPGAFKVPNGPLGKRYTARFSPSSLPPYYEDGKWDAEQPSQLPFAPEKGASFVRTSSMGSEPPVGFDRSESSNATPSISSRKSSTVLRKESAGSMSCSGKEDAEAGDRMEDFSNQGKRRQSRALQRLKTPLVERLRRIEERNRTKSEQLLRQRKFNALPKEEVQALSAVFHGIVRTGPASVERGNLMAGLREVGLQGTNTAEKREIRRLCAEITATPAERKSSGKPAEPECSAENLDLVSFALKIVPQVRQRLRGLQSDELLRHFLQFDHECRGRLPFRSCLEMARGFGLDEPLFRKEFEERQFGHERGMAAGDDSPVSFDEFQQIVIRVREVVERMVRQRERQVMETTGLSEDTFQEFRPDVAILYDIFCRHDVGKGFLRGDEVRLALREFGLMPSGMVSMREELNELLEGELEIDRESGFSFDEILWVVSALRGFWMEKHQKNHSHHFTRHDKDRTGQVTVEDISGLVCEVGSVPRNRREQDELARLIRLIDADGNGHIEFEEFQVLSQRIWEKLHSLRHEEEVDYAMSLGFSEEQYRQLRTVFDSLDLDGSTQLDAFEVRTALDRLHKHISDEAFNLAFKKLDTDNSGALGFFEFLEFLRMIRQGEGVFSDDAQKLPSQLKYVERRIFIRVLDFFHFSKTYASSLPKETLLEHVCNCLEIGATDDIQEMHNIRFVGDLYELARRRNDPTAAAAEAADVPAPAAGARAPAAEQHASTVGPGAPAPIQEAPTADQEVQQKEALLAATPAAVPAPAAPAPALDCWGDGTVYRYELCCGCGNDEGNYSGNSVCWSGDFSRAACCGFYGPPDSLPSLPCWRDERGYRRRLELRLAGRRLTLDQPLRAGSSNYNHGIAPYVLWPSAYALAAWLLSLPEGKLAGLRTVELGCGLGLPSLAAALAGASALATDVDDTSLALARRAAARNLPPGARARFAVRALDFTDEAAVRAAGPADMVLIAGQFYLERLHEPLLAATRLLCAGKCTLLMANWGSMQQGVINWFLEGLDSDFEQQEIFDCSDRGYAHPHAEYQCAMLSRRPSAGVR